MSRKPFFLLVCLLFFSCQEDTLRKDTPRQSNASSQNSFLSNVSELESESADDYLGSLFSLFFEKGPLNIYSMDKSMEYSFPFVSEKFDYSFNEDNSIELKQTFKCGLKTEDLYFDIVKRRDALRDISLLKSTVINYMNDDIVLSQNVLLQYKFVLSCLDTIESYKTVVNVYGPQLNLLLISSEVIQVKNGERLSYYLAEALRGGKGELPGELILNLTENQSLSSDQSERLSNIAEKMDIFFSGLSEHVDTSVESDYLLVDILREVSERKIIGDVNSFIERRSNEL